MTRTAYSVCRAWLRYEPRWNRPQVTTKDGVSIPLPGTPPPDYEAVKVASWGPRKTTGYGQEPVQDAIVANADLERALFAVPDTYIRQIGIDRRRYRTASEVVRHAAAANPFAWDSLRRDRMLNHKISKSTDADGEILVVCSVCGEIRSAAGHLDPLREALDRCATVMASIVGASFTEEA